MWLKHNRAAEGDQCELVFLQQALENLHLSQIQAASRDICVEKDEWKLQVIVDYTKSANNIYQEYVHQYISVLKSLRLLSFCEIQSSNADRLTWVLDWSRPQCANALRAQQYASGYMTCEVTGITDRVLKLTGIHVAVVLKTTAMDIGKGGDGDVITLIRKGAPSRVLERPYPGGLSMLEAYCCTMCHDTFSERIAPERTLFPSYSESLEVTDALVSRSRPGDHVTLILGCRSLMLLRPSGAGQYQIVGLAYLHGMNSAEPLYGPIPRPWRPAMKGDTGVFTEQLFLNSLAGELTNEDLRFVKFRKDEMIEGLYFGTRIPSIDALRNRGKPLKAFELI
ncbi:hypothetical protein F4782DRAFT_544829 [Xylaria castorea]|nr:hypothetical protein F4782DRAFT_544829 [Xylaria castorea]